MYERRFKGNRRFIGVLRYNETKNSVGGIFFLKVYSVVWCSVV